MRTSFTLAEGITHVGMLQTNTKVGFTLAEVLITLGIIGVISAMTIPALYGNYRKRATVARLQKAISVISQAYKLSNDEVGDITPKEAQAMGAEEYFKRYWMPYIKVGNYCKTYQECGYHKQILETLSGGKGGELGIIHKSGITFSTSDGMVYIIRTETDIPDTEDQVASAIVAVDINGSKLPNKY